MCPQCKGRRLAQLLLCGETSVYQIYVNKTNDAVKTISMDFTEQIQTRSHTNIPATNKFSGEADADAVIETRCYTGMCGESSDT